MIWVGHSGVGDYVSGIADRRAIAQGEMRVDGVQSVPDGIEERIFRHGYLFTAGVQACLFSAAAGLNRIQGRIPDAKDAKRIAERMMARKERQAGVEEDRNAIRHKSAGACREVRLTRNRKAQIVRALQPTDLAVVAWRRERRALSSSGSISNT